EVSREFLQVEARQLAGGDVLVLRKDPSIDQMTPENRILAVGNGSVVELHARSMAAESRTVAAEIERYFMPPRAGFEVFEIKAQQIMTLDDIGIATPDFIDKLMQHFGFVTLSSGNDALPPGSIGQSNRHDAVARARRIGISKSVCAISLDRELQAAEIAKRHLEEMSFSRP